MKNFLCAIGGDRKKARQRVRILSSSSSSSSSSEDDNPSDSEEDEEEAPPRAGSGKATKYKIPKFKGAGPWTDSVLENLRKNFPHLRNFDDDLLRHSSLKELINLGKSKISNSKAISNKMAQNVELLQNFPVQVEQGPDDCFGKVHKARFLRGFVGDAQVIWTQARSELGVDGHEPIGN